MSVLDATALPGATFGGLVHTKHGAAALTAAAEVAPEALLDLLDSRQGLLLLRGMDGITEEPELLLRLSRLCGSEVES